MQRARVKSRSEGSRGGREGDVERDILLPARAKIISPGLVGETCKRINWT